MSCKCCEGLNEEFLQLMKDILDGEVDISSVDITQAEPFYSIFAHIFNEQMRKKQMEMALRNNTFMQQISSV